MPTRYTFEPACLEFHSHAPSYNCESPKLPSIFIKISGLDVWEILGSTTNGDISNNFLEPIGVPSDASCCLEHAWDDELASTAAEDCFADFLANVFGLHEPALCFLQMTLISTYEWCPDPVRELEVF